MVGDDDSSCPSWFLLGPNHTCRCSSQIDRQVICSVRMWKLYLMMGYCMTWGHNVTQDIPGPILARCPFHYTYNPGIVDGYLPLSPDLQGENLTRYVCGHFHRTGELCNSCKEGYAPVPFSNGMACGKCKGNYLWLYYLVAQLVFLMAMFLLCALFVVQLTKSPFNVLVLYWQVFVVALNFDSVLYSYMSFYTKSAYVRAIISFYAVWNLDFFRYSVPPLCVSSALRSVDVLLFDYIVAVWPVLLTLVSYVCIDLYDREVRLVVLMWRPFRCCFARCFSGRRCITNNPKASVVKTFATFLTLAYTKLLFTSANLLYGTPVYDHDGKLVPPFYVLYYDAKIPYFSRAHAPYVAIGASMLVLTLLPPLLLLLYPTKAFNRALDKCGFRHWPGLHIFMDAFQGWYKDGTGEGGCDYRWVSALYLILRIGFLGQCMATTMSRNTNQLFWVLPGVVLMATALFYTTARPYKLGWMNNMDGLVLALLGINFFIFYQYFDDMVFVLGVVVATIPLLLPFLYGLHRLVKFTHLCVRLRNGLRGVVNRHRRTFSSGDVDDPPYRMIHPDSYQNSSERGTMELEAEQQPRVLSNYGTFGYLEQ